MITAYFSQANPGVEAMSSSHNFTVCLLALASKREQTLIEQGYYWKRNVDISISLTNDAVDYQMPHPAGPKAEESNDEQIKIEMNLIVFFKQRRWYTVSKRQGIPTKSCTIPCISILF